MHPTCPLASVPDVVLIATSAILSLVFSQCVVVTLSDREARFRLLALAGAIAIATIAVVFLGEPDCVRESASGRGAITSA